MNKYIVGIILSLGVFILPPPTQAASFTDVQIQAILGLLSSFGVNSTTIADVTAVLRGTTPISTGETFCHNFNDDITVGNKGDEVSALNQALSSSGIDTTGNSSTFGERSVIDVIAFQKKYGIRQTGYVGPLTRAKLNTLYGCHTVLPSTVPATTTPSSQAPAVAAPEPTVVATTTTVAATTTPAITVLYPNGGEVLRTERTYVIRWSASEISTVDIFLDNSTGGVAPVSIAKEIDASKGWYEWTVPGGLSGTEYKIRVTSGSLIQDTSDASFTIVRRTS